MKMDKLKGVQCVSPLNVHSELCLMSVGHLNKELLKLECKKSLYFVCAP